MSGGDPAIQRAGVAMMRNVARTRHYGALRPTSLRPGHVAERIRRPGMDERIDEADCR